MKRALRDVRVSPIKRGGKIIGYNVRRLGVWLAGPFRSTAEAKTWIEVAYGPIPEVKHPGLRAG